MFIKILLQNFIFYAEVAKDLIKLAVISTYFYMNTVYCFFFPSRLKSLTEERILIIGAAAGIGRQICIQLAKTNAMLICWDISKRNNESLVAELRSMGLNAFYYNVDITCRTTVEETAKKMRKDVGEVTMIINTVGITPCHSFLSHNPRQIQQVFQVNVIGHIWVLREFLPSMIQNKKGHIVTLSSTGGLIGVENFAPYCGTQHAIHGTIEALKEELNCLPYNQNIVFTTVFPNYWSTRFSKNVITSRFSNMLPTHLDQSFIAAEIINGIKRNEEFVYIPSVCRFIGTVYRALSPNVQRHVRKIVQYHIKPESG